MSAHDKETSSAQCPLYFGKQTLVSGIGGKAPCRFSAELHCPPRPPASLAVAILIRAGVRVLVSHQCPNARKRRS